MTQEEKSLLLQDLCARLPYGVIVDYKENKFETPHWKITTIYPETMDGWIGYNKKIGVGSESGSRPFDIGEVKPYLRLMQSMTEEEKEEFRKLKQFSVTVVMPNGVSLLKPTYIVDLEEDGEGLNHLYDWLNAHHFDYRKLIEKGLALEAPEGMYKNY